MNILDVDPTGYESETTGRVLVALNGDVRPKDIRQFVAQNLKSRRQLESFLLQVDVLDDLGLLVLPQTAAATDLAGAAFAKGLIEAASLEMRIPGSPLVDVPLEEAIPGTSILEAIGVGDMPGKVKIAILDSGIDIRHVDYQERIWDVRTFTNVSPFHHLGHGTAMTGLVCGARVPAEGQRYGVAHGATVIFGCIYDDAFDTTDAIILQALRWAMRQNAVVAYVGVESLTRKPFRAAFEIAARRLLRKGLVIVAAAGNGAGPVVHPGNCPSVLAVGGLLHIDGQFKQTDNSAVGKETDPIDVAAPGFPAIRSSAPQNGYRASGGTSHAAALVTGVAALWAERCHLRGKDLWHAVTGSAVRTPNAYAPKKVGCGVARAPQCARGRDRLW
ncbi:MAG TPA: S8 family serine peptidase [Thermoanaerobaculia bacterium]